MFPIVGQMAKSNGLKFFVDNQARQLVINKYAK